MKVFGKTKRRTKKVLGEIKKDVWNEIEQKIILGVKRRRQEEDEQKKGSGNFFLKTTIEKNYQKKTLKETERNR